MRLARFVFIGAGIWGIAGTDTVILARRYQWTSLCRAQRLPAVLLWIYWRGDRLADRISDDRIKSGAIPDIHDPGDDREVRLCVDAAVPLQASRAFPRSICSPPFRMACSVCCSSWRFSGREPQTCDRPARSLSCIRLTLEHG